MFQNFNVFRFLSTLLAASFPLSLMHSLTVRRNETSSCSELPSLSAIALACSSAREFCRSSVVFSLCGKKHRPFILRPTRKNYRHGNTEFENNYFLENSVCVCVSHGRDAFDCVVYLAPTAAAASQDRADADFYNYTHITPCVIITHRQTDYVCSMCVH